MSGFTYSARPHISNKFTFRNLPCSKKVIGFVVAAERRIQQRRRYANQTGHQYEATRRCTEPATNFAHRC